MIAAVLACIAKHIDDKFKMMRERVKASFDSHLKVGATAASDKTASYEEEMHTGLLTVIVVGIRILAITGG